MNKTIKFSEIKVGQQYQYEESYFMVANVTIMEDTSDDTHFRFTLRIDEWIAGLAKPKKENEVLDGTFDISITKEEGLQYYMKMSFKNVGSWLVTI
jgi:hypothetical protein